MSSLPSRSSLAFAAVELRKQGFHELANEITPVMFSEEAFNKAAKDCELCLTDAKIVVETAFAYHWEENEIEKSLVGSEPEQETMGESNRISDGSILPPFNFAINLEQYLGRKVRRRDGTVAMISQVYPDRDSSEWEILNTNDDKKNFANGRFYEDGSSDYDIVEVLPKGA